MALVDQKKKKKKKKNQNRVTENRGMQLPGTSSLASIESLAIPLVSFLSLDPYIVLVFNGLDHHHHHHQLVLV